jgi:hypothetical protein
MIWPLYATATLFVVCVMTPLWYLPYRRILEHFAHTRYRSGRVKRATMLDWLSATGLGLFVGALLAPFVQMLWFGK